MRQRYWVLMVLGLAGCGLAYAQTTYSVLQGLVDDTSPATTRENAYGPIRSTPARGLHVTLYDPTGAYVAAGGGGGGGGGTVAISQTSTDNDVDANVTALPNEGQQTMANSISVAIASNQSAVPVSQSGTWTVQPGNTANSTPWLVGDGTGPFTVDGTVAATQSGTWTSDTELPAAAALADGTANPTVPATAAFGLLWNGTTWDRRPGSTALGALSDTELPAAAALATGMSNPTAPATAAFQMLWNGTTWDRMGGSTTSGVTVNTELPAAASITDNLAVSTTTTAAALGMVYDGSNWDRLPGTSTDGALVNLGANNDVQGTGVTDAAISGNGFRITGTAVSHSGPTEVTVGDTADIKTNLEGAIWSIGGSPGLENIYLKWTSAQTDTVLKAISASSIFVLTEYHVGCSNANTVNTDVTLEWDDAADVPFDGRDGIPAGGGWSVGAGGAAVRSGADGQDLLITASAPTTGSCTFSGRGYVVGS